MNPATKGGEAEMSYGLATFCRWMPLLRGFHTPSYPAGISLLQYADDSMFSWKNSMEEGWNLSMLLDLFAYCLGLQINFCQISFFWVWSLA